MEIDVEKLKSLSTTDLVAIRSLMFEALEVMDDEDVPADDEKRIKPMTLMEPLQKELTTRINSLFIQ